MWQEEITRQEPREKGITSVHDCMIPRDSEGL